MKELTKPILLALSLIVILFVANSWEVFNYPPLSIHQWRQSDCAAYVKTFYRTGANVFNPATYNLAGKEGKVVSEFPILYYLAAKIQYFTGEHYWVIRGLTFLTYVAGLFALLACVKRWVSDNIYALFPILLLASSPCYYYYAINFLPNVPAISFSFIGLYYYIRFDEQNKWQYLTLGTLFFLLATVLKPTDGGILWIAYILTWCLMKGYNYVKNKEKIHVLPLFLSILTIGLGLFGWVKYVNWYNDENGNHQNLVDIFPIWQMDEGLIKYTKERIATLWSNHFQQDEIVLMLKCCAYLYVLLWWWLHKFLRLITLFLFAGLYIYCQLWFKAFTDHDYYQLIYVIPSVFLLITIMEFFNRLVLPKINSYLKYASYAMMLGILFVSFIHNRNIQRERYTFPIFIYTNLDLFTVEPYLRSIGIKPTDKVVSIPDNSPNITLNAINQFGYSEAFTDNNYNIKTFQAKGASYLIVSDTNYVKKTPLYHPFLTKPIGEYKGIRIFDIR